MTFEQLDLLLRQVSEGMDGSSDWPPPQEKECMVVATLNLLRLQVIVTQVVLNYIGFIHFFVTYFSILNLLMLFGYVILVWPSLFS